MLFNVFKRGEKPPDRRPLVIGPISTLMTVSDVFATPDNELGCISDAFVVVDLISGTLLWLGPSSDLPKAYLSSPRQSVGKGLVTPGLIDAHTHPVFAGDRADEFQARLTGKTYQELAQAGGGIWHTVNHTRAASEAELTGLAETRFQQALASGVTTIEAKSGYGLTLDDELKSLRVLKTLQSTLAINIIPTVMAAHDIPHDFKHDPNAYVDVVCDVILPAVAAEQLAVFNDVFCEAGYFSREQSERILRRGLELGLLPKIHAEEFTNQAATQLACELGAASADHLLQIDDAGLAALEGSQTVPVLLPATAFFLGMTDYAPVNAMLERHLPVALATDFNPGSSNCNHLLSVMAIACLQMRMPVAAVFRAVTLNAAKALRLEHDRGSLVVGKRADLTQFTVSSPAELLYDWARPNRVEAVWVAGQRVVWAPPQQTIATR